MRPSVGLMFVLFLKTSAAEVITSTFGPGDAFTAFGGYQVASGAVTGRADELAVAFTPTFDAIFTQIRVAVFDTPPLNGDRDLIVDLSEGPVPGAPLETFATTVLDGDARIYTFNSALHPELLAGLTYWIVLGSNDLVDNSYGWNFSDTWQFFTMAEDTPRSGTWQLFSDTPPAFDVSGQGNLTEAVPEPDMMLGLGVSLLLVGLYHRKSEEKSLRATRHEH
jgi:hypothetical protein